MAAVTVPRKFPFPASLTLKISVAVAVPESFPTLKTQLVDVFVESILIYVLASDAIRPAWLKSISGVVEVLFTELRVVAPPIRVFPPDILRLLALSKVRSTVFPPFPNPKYAPL